MELKKKMHLKRTTEPIVVTFLCFQISMHILCLSNHLGRPFSLYLLVHLAKTYENEWSRCSNEQIIKNLWLLEASNLVMQCYATQYSNAFSSLGCADLEKLYEIKKKCIPNGRPSQKLWHFKVSKFPCAFSACLINLDARFF